MEKRGYYDFSFKIFCHTVPKYFIGEHFYRKFSCIGGGHQGFVEVFCLTGPKRKALQSNPSVFRKFSGIEKNLWIRGGLSRFSVENFMSHSAEKFRGHPFNVSENLGYRKILCIIGGITIFHLKFFVSQC